MKTNKIEMSPADSRETYEMLRASHTLLRMAFGAICLLYKPESKEEANRLNKKFDSVFKIIGNAASEYIKFGDSVPEGSDESN